MIQKQKKDMKHTYNKYIQFLAEYMPHSVSNDVISIYRILLNKCTVRVEVGKNFCRRGVVRHLY